MKRLSWQNEGVSFLGIVALAFWMGSVECVHACAACSAAFAPSGWWYEGFGQWQYDDTNFCSGEWYHIWWAGDTPFLHQGNDPDECWYDGTELPIDGCPIPGFPSAKIRGDGTNPDAGRAATEEPANAINGALLDFSEDLRAGKLVFSRAYSSAETGAFRVGVGWRDSFEWRLEAQDTNGIVYRLERGIDSSVQFLLDGGEGCWKALRDVPWTMVFTDSVFRVKTSPGNELDFDSAGRWVAARDGSGTATCLSYDGEGRLSSVTNNLGDRFDFTYDPLGGISRIGTQRATLWRTYSRGATGHLTNTALHASGKTFSTEYAFDSAWHCVAVTNPDGTSAQYAFDGVGRTVSIVPGDGFFAHSIAYETNHWVVDGHYEDEEPWEWVDTSHWETGDHTVVAYRRNGETTNRVDYFPDEAKERVLRIEGPDSADVRRTFLEDVRGMPTEKLWESSATPVEYERQQWSYGARMNPTELRHTFRETATTHIEWNIDETLPVAVVDPAGLRTEMDWDEVGRLVETRDFPDAGTTNRTIYAYGTDGLLESVTDGDGGTTSFFYDTAHNPTSVVDSAGVATDMGWDDLGHLVSVARRGSPSTSMTVDDRGLVRSVVHPDGLSETFSYDALGRLTNAVGRDGETTAFRPAAYGVAGAIVHSGAAVETDYDGMRDVRAVRDSLGRTAEAYGRDARGRVVAVTNGEGQVASISYGPGERPIAMSRFDGTSATFAYDALGHLSRVSTPRMQTGFSWLANGVLAGVSNASGTVSWQRDGRGAVTNESGPAGNMAWRLTPAGIVTNYACRQFSASAELDAGGRTTNLVFSLPGMPDLSFGFAWASGTHRLASVFHPNGISADFACDVLDRPLSIAWSCGPSMAYAYSNDFVCAIEREDGSRREFAYDALGHLVSETVTNAAGETLRSSSWTWDWAGNRLSKTVVAEGAADVAYAYASGDRLSGWSALLRRDTLSVPVAGEVDEPIGLDDRFGELYVRVGNGPDEIPAVSGSRFWTAPKVFPLTADTAVAAAIRDTAGNTTRATNAVRPAAVTNAVYGYTAAGCVSNAVFTGTGGFSRTLAIDWDDLYRPTSFAVSTSAGENTATNAVSIVYDGLGRILSLDEDGESFTRLYNGDMPFADFDSTGGLRRVWLAAPGIDRWLGFVDYAVPETPAFYTYCTDAQGSILAVADAAGSVVETYDYDAWGRLLAIRDGAGCPLARSAVGNRIYWQGREYFPGLGLYHFRARWYDPVTGRFFSKDPVGIAAGLNLYVFCGGDPVNHLDPYGTSWQSVACSFAVGVVVGAVVAAAIATAVPAVTAVLAAAWTPTAASITMTVTMTVAGGVGVFFGAKRTITAISESDWDSVGYNVGAIAGGLAVGGYYSRSLVKGISGRETALPKSASLREIAWFEWASRYRRNYPGGDWKRWLASGPTPLGATALVELNVLYATEEGGCGK